MRVRAWRFITLLLAALSMGMAWAHALELGPKMALSETDYIVVQGIYQEFGRLGAVIEPAAILATAILTLLVRGRRLAFRFSLTGLALLALAFGVWIAFVMPANAELAAWAATAAPADWQRIRNQWEYAHLARFILQLGGFCALLVSVLAETPGDESAA